jgi:hypothetical protein
MHGITHLSKRSVHKTVFIDFKARKIRTLLNGRICIPVRSLYEICS